ncbi:MAG: tetratricopeptide repeat protein [Brevinema sp.]
MKVLLLVAFFGTSVSIFAQTEVELRRTIQQNPRNIQAYADLIELATTRDRILKVGNEALNAVGSSFLIQTAMGNAYMKAQDYNSAINAYRIAVSLNPRSATGFNRLGLALMRISYFRQAEVSFNAAIAYSPNNSQANLIYKTHLGLVFENLKEYDKAKKIIDEVLQVNGDLVLALEIRRRLNNI